MKGLLKSIPVRAQKGERRTIEKVSVLLGNALVITNGMPIETGMAKDILMRPQPERRNMLLEIGDEESFIIKKQRSWPNCVPVLVFCAK